MGRLTLLWGMLILTIIALGFAYQNNLQRQKKAVQFERASKSAAADVRKCLRDSNGKRLFEDFKPMPVRQFGNGQWTFLSPSGSRLSIAPQPDGAIIKLTSDRVSAEQFDILEWCSRNPEKLWLSKSAR